mmetsp:Transcript_42238/g.99171  ORF Transcript_42238/g.99171 Transcript_42238/m.99171 type:complete len:196 (+) Transcript_42238:109-696(+)
MAFNLDFGDPNSSGFRPVTTDPVKRRREAGFVNPGVNAPLPMYKTFFDDHLKVLWKSPSKKAYLKSLGFLDEGGNMVDIHAQRRKFHVVESEMAMSEKMARARQKELQQQQQDRQILATREAVNQMRLAKIQEEREYQKIRRQAQKDKYDKLMASISTPDLKGAKSSLTRSDRGGRGDALSNSYGQLPPQAGYTM